jgi:hypothetical protein
MSRLRRDWAALDADQRLAAVAALALFVTMLLPWYQQNAVVNAPRAAPLQSRNLDAFQVFSFVEAAVLLVALAVAYLLYARAEGHQFRLPGGDGTVVFAAGLWAGVLLVLRLFDKPGISSHGVAANVGVQWGIFFALVAAGLLAYAGSRMRAHERPQAPLLRTRREGRPGSPDREDDGPRAADAPTAPERPREPDVASESRGRPSSGSGTARAAARQDATTPLTAAGRARERAAGSAPVPARPRYPPAPVEQLSFDDPPARRD